MSVLCTLPGGWIISHDRFIEQVYESVHYSIDEKLALDTCLFQINTPFTRTFYNVRDARSAESDYSEPSSRKKRKRENENSLIKDIESIEKKCLDMINEGRKHGYLNYISTESDKKLNNLDARNKAHGTYLHCPTSRLHGANNTTDGLITYVDNECYVIPRDCQFFSYDIKDINNKLNLLLPPYDLILLDPPWWNKYIRRKNARSLHAGYQMMYDDALSTIPIATLTAVGGIIAVWCTNSVSHLSCLCNEILPAWGFEFIAKWYWVKVTRGGKPVCQFSPPPGKQPFEQIVFGCRRGENRNQPLPEPDKIIVSVPSAIHSHKPPLSEVLSPYLPSKPRCLELFARYLLPGWTSWGFEVLKLQHRSLYVTRNI